MRVPLGPVVLSAVPVSAQVVVRDRDDVVIREHDHIDRGHHGYRAHAECRTVRVKTRLPNGDVVVKTRREC